MPRAVTIERRLKVVLEKKGKATLIEPYVARLEFRADKGISRGFRFGPQKEITDCRNVIFSGAALGELQHCLTLEAAKDETGKIKLWEIHEEKVPEDERRYCAAAMKLRINWPDSGFVIQPWERHRQPLWKVLKTAPETGYTPELVLDEKKMKEWGRSQQGIGSYPSFAFFLKIGRFYGRGYFSEFKEVTAENDGSRLRAILILELQPDGTRNLENSGDSDSRPPKQGWDWDQPIKADKTPLPVDQDKEKLPIDAGKTRWLRKERWRIQGTVQDDKGTPLDGVKVYYPRDYTSALLAKFEAARRRSLLRKDYPNWAYDRFRHSCERLEDAFHKSFAGSEKRHYLIDSDSVTSRAGKFRIDIKNRSTEWSHLRIEHAGYYHFESTRMHLLRPEDEAADVEFKMNMNIVLDRIGYPTELKKVEGRLAVYADGRHQVLQLGPPGNVADIKAMIVPEAELGKLRRCISLDISKGPDGQFAIDD